MRYGAQALAPVSIQSPEILCLGEAMVEFSAPDEGAGGWLQGFGGDTSNCAVAAARQGGRVGYISAVGRDMFGDMLIELGVETPVNLTARQRELLREFEGLSADNHPEGSSFFSKVKSFWDGMKG